MRAPPPSGPNSLEPFTELAWPCFAGILFGIHHHYILQAVALVRGGEGSFEVWLCSKGKALYPPSLPPSSQLSHVNLNYILCPATVDPFNGPHYRTAAILHQTICLLTLGKLYTLVVKAVLKALPEYQPIKSKED